jgi:hypothetical protein
MRTVEIRVPRSELSGRMAMMRMWLDEHRFEPSTFNCRDAEEGVLVRIEFKVASEAGAFAARFDGRLSGSDGETQGELRRGVLKSALPPGIVG